MKALLGCIADDFTGATDLANMLTRGGMRTLQTIGVPAGAADLPEADALVVALKSRTIPAAEAVAQSVAALDWLKGRGCRQFLFKYCSTFDSTDAGNIGPVADALLARLGADFTIACPAFPENRRTIFNGYLFVGTELLSESPMKDHPLTPMTDANLVRVLQRQTKASVGLVPYAVVREGAAAIRGAFERLRADGVRHAIVDAVEDAHLVAIGAACADLAFVTGGSGVALGLPENFRRAGLLTRVGSAALMPPMRGHAAVIAGSCSKATQAQVAAMKSRFPSMRIDPQELADGAAPVVDRAIGWAATQVSKGPVLVYSTAAPDAVRAAQEAVGKDHAATLVEDALAAIAKALVAHGVRRLVVAGGETSGAVVSALGVKALAIGPQIDPGVPWTFTVPGDPVALALKSGNFGAEDFFMKALGMLEQGQQQQ
jgi:3-dehydrotetronate 4-kinase